MKKRVCASDSAWSFRRVPVSAHAENITIFCAGVSAGFSDVLAGWENSEPCRRLFLEVLAATSYPAFLWEMPPIGRAHRDRSFECVVIRNDALHRGRPDSTAFAAVFGRTNDSVAVFANLGGDALLVAPRQLGAADAYPHLAAFVRAGPLAQRHEFLIRLGRAVLDDLQKRAGRVWISTSGLGVPWLHVRIDSSPKYYQHGAYRST